MRWDQVWKLLKLIQARILCKTGYIRTKLGRRFISFGKKSQQHIQKKWQQRLHKRKLSSKCWIWCIRSVLSIKNIEYWGKSSRFACPTNLLDMRAVSNSWCIEIGIYNAIIYTQREWNQDRDRPELYLKWKKSRFKFGKRCCLLTRASGPFNRRLLTSWIDQLCCV